MKKHCKICHSILHRWGHSVSGKQRWKCPNCSKTSSLTRRDVSLKHRTAIFLKWLGGNASLTELCAVLDVSRRTLNYWFEEFWKAKPNPVIPKSLTDTYFVVDAIYLDGHHHCVLIGRSGQGHIVWEFAEQETFSAWFAFFSKLPKPKAIVCDGQGGLLSAVKTVFPQTPVQRCLIHIHRLAIMKLTRNPRTVAGQELLSLVSAVHSLKMPQDQTLWLAAFWSWSKKWETFLKERTYGISPTGQHHWWYTHRRIRALKRTLEQAIPQMFVFIDIAGIPRTTNLVEGGINSRLADLLRRHRGVSLEHKKVLVAHYLNSRNGVKKPTRNCT